MNAVACFAKGFRTIAAALAFLITGLLSVFGGIDLTPVIALFVKDPALLGAAMVGVGALFGLLRYMTTTPLFSAHSSHRVIDGGDGVGEDEAPNLKRDCDRGL